MTTKRQQGYRVTLNLWLPVDPRSVDDTIKKSETVRDLLSGAIALPAGCEVEADKSRSLWTSRTPPELGMVASSEEPGPVFQDGDIQHAGSVIRAPKVEPATSADAEPTTVTRLRSKGEAA